MHIWTTHIAIRLWKHNVFVLVSVFIVKLWLESLKNMYIEALHQYSLLQAAKMVDQLVCYMRKDRER